MSAIDFRLGRYQDVLDSIEEVDAVLSDTPYSKRTHGGHDDLRQADTAARRRLSYTAWDSADVEEFVESWAWRCRGWFVVMSDHILQPVWAGALESAGRYVFAPLPIVIRGMSVRLAGDGPSSWTIWLTVARPRTKEFATWGTLPGAYLPRKGADHIGGKPLELMQALVRDYSRSGDLICDPCAGAATTLVAAEAEGRRAIGAEVDPKTYGLGRQRIDRGVELSLPGMEAGL